MAQSQSTPPDARYGVYNTDTDEWTGEWFTTDQEAAEAHQAVINSGLPLAVMACRDDIDDTWLDRDEWQ